jgi:hypothetical protein
VSDDLKNVTIGQLEEQGIVPILLDQESAYTLFLWLDWMKGSGHTYMPPVALELHEATDLFERVLVENQSAKEPPRYGGDG